MMVAPILFRWTGDAMEPLSRFHNVANAAFVVGEVYRMESIEERSLVSHRHYFAVLHEAWMNLPDAESVKYATAEHLRKHCLIMTGYREERKLVASSQVEARKIAAFIRPRDEYAIVSVSGNTVIEWTAKSQSMKAMGKAQFQKSKDDVLTYAADLIGISPDELSKQREAA